jgi:hypothetical protein
MKFRKQTAAALTSAAAALVLGVATGIATGTAEAATCMDELDRFERRLHGSGIAATDPDRFQALVRQAEEAAELRDEEQCLQSVAELNAGLPEDSGVQPGGSQTSTAPDKSDSASRPAPPVLLIAGGDETDDTATADETDEAAFAEDEADEDNIGENADN